jgi:hypothetical protein
MIKSRFIAVLAALAVFIPARAWTYNSQAVESINDVQIRVGAEFMKKWRNGIHLSLSENLYSSVYNSATGAAFKTSYTTLTFAYKPIEYLKLDVGYTLKFSNKGVDDPNELLRHRVFFSVTGMYKFDYVKLSLRERVLMEARTDSVNPLEKNKFNWQLRSKIGAEFYVPGKPVKPYVSCELINTLNAPEYQMKYKLNDPTNPGRQFITRIRPQVGVKWRLTRLSSLDFFYRFTYGYNRDVNITKTKQYIELTERTLFQHALGVRYHLNW